MKYIKSYHIYESESFLSFVEVCDELLFSTPIWKASRNLINPNVSLEIDTEGEKNSEAHFDINQSTPNKIVVQMSNQPQTEEDKGSLAHELVHALQWLTDGYNDLMFITDITREAIELSDFPLWERLMYAIYISCPQETEAWEANNIYYRHGILNEILPWMSAFNPQEAADELLRTTPNSNQWDLMSFDQLPSFWAEAYEAYGEQTTGSDIPGLGELSLEEFLDRYKKLFTVACDRLR
jgi:hypothetical protein